MVPLKKRKDWLLEIAWLVRGCLTSFWFWLPILFMGYVLFQLWMMIFIHPLTLLILPVIMIVYGLRNEEKRIEARYGLARARRLKWSHGLGADPEVAPEDEWKVEQLVKEYEDLLKEKDETTED